MPIYEYKCLKCNKSFEKLVLNSNQTILCPECNSDDVKRQMSRFGYKVSGSSGDFSKSLNTGSSCSTCSSHNCSQCH